MSALGSKQVWTVVLPDGEKRVVPAQVTQLSATGVLMFGSITNSPGIGPQFDAEVLFAPHAWNEARRGNLVS